MRRIVAKSLSWLMTLVVIIGLVGVMPARKVEAASFSGNDVVTYARQFLGYPYVWGTRGPNSFDCSGFVQYVYKKFGVDLPSGTDGYAGNGYANYGEKITDKRQLQLGDVVYYSAGHVGIYSGSGKMINAVNANTGVAEIAIDQESWQANGKSGLYYTGTFSYGIRIKGVYIGTPVTS